MPSLSNTAMNHPHRICGRALVSPMNIDAGTVAVAIVAYGRAEEVAGCLAALQRSTFRDFEVLVIENGGADCFDRLTAAVTKDRPVAGGVDAVADPRRAGNRALASR